MYAHVTTYRLSTMAEARIDADHYLATGDTVMDQTARLWASWWATKETPALKALAEGKPFDTKDLYTEFDSCKDVLTEVRSAFESYIINLEAHLAA